MKPMRIVIGVSMLLVASVANARDEHRPPSARPSICAADFTGKVFFQTNKATIADQNAQDIVSLIAKLIARCRPVSVIVTGFSDKSELPSVAPARAETVVRALAGRGVPRALLHSRSRGAVDFLMPPPNVQNRRVEMTLTYR